MNTLFAVIVLGAVAVIAGVPMMLGRMGEKKARAQRERAERIRSERMAARKESSQTLPAVKRSRLATPVGTRR